VGGERDSAPSDDVTAFLDGETELLPLELEEMEDVDGAELLHLQCLVGLRTCRGRERALP